MAFSKNLSVLLILGICILFCHGCKDLKDRNAGFVVNTAPVVQPIPDQTAVAGNALLLNLAPFVSDADPDSALTFQVVTGGGFFSGSQYINHFALVGFYTVQFSVTDTEGLSSTGSFNVDVLATPSGNTAPVIANIDPQNAVQNSPFSLDLASYITDDNDAPAALSYAVISGGGSFTGTTYNNTFTSAATVTVEFLVMDTGSMSAYGSFDVTVAVMPNDPPVISTIPGQNATKGATFILDLAGFVNDPNDADDTLTYEVTSGQGTFYGTLYTAMFNTTGVKNIEITITDPWGLDDVDTFDIDVQEGTPANLAPVISAIAAQNATQLVPFALDIADQVTDEDADADLVFGVISGGGSFTGTTYLNTFDSAGGVTVEFVVMDSLGMSSSGFFDVTVAAAANNSPVFAGLSEQTALVGATFVIDLSTFVTDVEDGVEDLTFTVTGGGGSFSGPVYFNNFGTSGLHTINFDIEDTQGAVTSDSFDVRAHVSPSASFTSDVVLGDAPLTVQFTDQSAGTVTSWEWDFDANGTVDSTAQNPTYIYGAPGIYTVILTVNTPVGADTRYELDYIFVLTSGEEEAEADFVVDSRLGRAPLTVQFTDMTVGLVSNWFWDFDNDGTVDSTAQNPTFTYDTVGRYDVRLTVAGDGGFDTVIKEKYIVVVENAWYVDSSIIVSTGDGTTWSQAFQTIQSGIDNASPTDLVLVADGTYTGTSNTDIDFGGKSIYLKMEDYYGSGVCTIDCEGSARGFYFANAETNDAVIDGFTIINGSATNGGAIFCDGASPKIINCTITANSATLGGGIYCTNSSDPLIINSSVTGCTAGTAGGGIYMGISCAGRVETCAITGNTSTGDGGGIYCDQFSSAVITKCTIANNHADNGGGISCFQSSATAVYNCIITNNSADNNGGAMECFNCNPSFINCALTNNSALGKDGGGMFIGGTSSPVTTNCTIVNNTGKFGGGVNCASESNPTFNNCIIWGNIATLAGNQICPSTANAVALLNYCNVPDDITDPERFSGSGTVVELGGSVYDIPLFVDPGSPGVGGGGDYLIITGSPCVDTGNNALIVLGATTDLAGNQRIVNGTVDIGAYEYQWEP